MKKILAMAIGAAVVASFASAQTYSKNAVGFINKTVEAEKMYALTMPFDNMDKDSPDGSWKFADLQLAKDAEIGSYVYFWDGTKWKDYYKNFLGDWTCEDYALKPGECFFFKPADDTPVVMTGQVPDSDTTAVSVAGAENMSAIGNPYPVKFVFSESKLAEEATTGTYVYFWDGTKWKDYYKTFLGTWTCEDREVEPGEGFFFQTTDEDESSRWNVEKAYDWP